MRHKLGHPEYIRRDAPVAEGNHGPCRNDLCWRTVSLVAELEQGCLRQVGVYLPFPRLDGTKKKIQAYGLS